VHFVGQQAFPTIGGQLAEALAHADLDYAAFITWVTGFRPKAKWEINGHATRLQSTDPTMWF
jgi:hypothetical protein